ncbi:M15 family metallopeptidase [Oscillospiraceae bacterium WX1]
MKYMDPHRDFNNLSDGDQASKAFLATNDSQKTNPSDILLVNALNPLPNDYRPKKLVKLYNQKNNHFQMARADIEVCETVYQAMDAMFAAAGKTGVNGFIITSGYRTREEQRWIFSNTRDGTAAKPGESEHETGLAFDVTALGDENFEQTPEFEWLYKHCAEYGFILRYPKGMEDITGYPYEPWHYRYVGKEIATIIMQKEMTLEQYLESR